MFASWWKLGVETTLLALEAQQVVALRPASLMLGGPAAIQIGRFSFPYWLIK